VPAVRADRAQLQQVVMNLITNASDALDERPGRVTLRTYVADLGDRGDTLPPLGAGRYVALEVEDDGVGMSDATRARIFEPFFTTKAMGRGLGMAAILGILRGHRGGIRVRSTPGQGACFTVFLPACEESAEAAAPASRTSLRAEGTVLVVDDEASIRVLARHICEDLGLATLAAANGVEAVALFRDRHAEIALVLLDLVMPVMGGAETLRALKAIDPAVPVVMSSGYDTADAVSDLPTSEIAGFLQKPYHPDEVERMVGEVLGREREAEPRRVAERFNDAINARDITRLVGLMTNDHAFIDTEGTRTEGRDAAERAWRAFFSAFPDYRNELASAEARGGAVVFTGRSSCSEPALDGPGLWRAIVRGGCVAEWRVYEDTAENRRALALER
jgi:CheY-like chemotaxis protein/ketosteroid isomerase-like protein